MYQNICITGALVVGSSESKKSNLYISEGKITNICDEMDLTFDADIKIDGKDLIVFPGMIDTHVHLRDGDFSHRESFSSGTKAAAASGVTTLFEMPGCDKPACTRENLIKRYEIAKSKAYVNIGFYGGAGFDNISEILPLADAGVIGFKTFRMPPVKGREKEFFGLCAVSFDDLVLVMREVAKTNLSLTIHCEDSDIINNHAAKQMKLGNTLKEFSNSRPEIAEINSVKEAIEAAKITGCKTIIAHVSSPKSINLIKKAQSDGVNIYSETCPHYLFFDEESVKKHGVFARVKPPIRKKSSANRLLEHFIAGDTDIIGSDHAPYTALEKLKNGDDIWNTVDGIPSVEMSTRLILNLLSENKMTYEQIAKNISQNAAELFGLKNKGRIKIGYDADLFIIKKSDKNKKINISDLHTKCKSSAVVFKELSFSHEIMYTLVDGQIVYDADKNFTGKCCGKIINK